jgi:complement component 1 Q subcomponent-binding protein
MPDDQPQEEGQNQEQDYEGPSENYCDFTVYITQANSKKGLVVEATSMETEIQINNVLCSNEISRLRALPRFERSMQEYNGPDFTTLDERIQTSLTEYLEGFGVNEHLAAFVECMSLDKDQRLYMKWLSDLKIFIN